MKIKTLIISILITSLSLNAYAVCNEGEENCWDCGNNCTARLKDRTLTLSGTGAAKDWFKPEVVPWASSREAITSIVFENGITSIGSFYGYSENLSEVFIPNSVKHIDDVAFSYSPNLKTLVIPESVKTINNSAFRFSGLTTLYCSTENKEICENALSTSNISSDILKTYEKSGGRYISDGKIYNSLNDLFNKKEFIPKRIYTVEEAEKVSKKTGNTFKLRYK